jgi:hypothetical protein
VVVVVSLVETEGAEGAASVLVVVVTLTGPRPVVPGTANSVSFLSASAAASVASVKSESDLVERSRDSYSGSPAGSCSVLIFGAKRMPCLAKSLISSSVRSA